MKICLWWCFEYICCVLLSPYICSFKTNFCREDQYFWQSLDTFVFQDATAEGDFFGLLWKLLKLRFATCVLYQVMSGGGSVQQERPRTPSWNKQHPFIQMWFSLGCQGILRGSYVFWDIVAEYCTAGLTCSTAWSKNDNFSFIKCGAWCVWLFVVNMCGS